MADDSDPVRNAIPICPLCGGKMELVHDELAMKVCICADCHTGVHVPIGAWERKLAQASGPLAPLVEPPPKGAGLLGADDVDAGTPTDDSI